MKKFSVVAILGILSLALGNVITAQVGQVGGAYTESEKHILNKKPVPYPYLREADEMWSKIIWRIIDLREKMNHPLYYPTNPIGNRMSLVDVLLQGTDNYGIPVYNAEDPLNEFKVPMTKEQVDEAFDAVDQVIQIEDINNPGNYIDQTIKGERNSSEVKQILVKEKWFFDKQHSVMKVRVIGLCPIRVYTKNGRKQKKYLFWAYFPDFREVFASHEVYNPYNDAQRISFDDLFIQRRFNSYIVAESNPYNNRRINEYTIGLESLLEAEKIKQWLFEKEHDLWEY